MPAAVSWPFSARLMTLRHSCGASGRTQLRRLAEKTVDGAVGLRARHGQKVRVRRLQACQRQGVLASWRVDFSSNLLVLARAIRPSVTTRTESVVLSSATF